MHDIGKISRAIKNQLGMYLLDTKEIDINSLNRKSGKMREQCNLF